MNHKQIEINRNEFADRICTALDELGFSMSSLSRKTDIPSTTIWSWCYGITCPNYHNLCKLAQVLNLELDYFSIID